MPVGQHVEGEPRLFRALGDADRGLVENDVDPVESFRQKVGIANIPIDDLEAKPGGGVAQVLPAPPHEIVQDHDFARLLLRDEIGDVGADKAGAASYQDALVLHGNPPLAVVANVCSASVR